MSGYGINNTLPHVLSSELGSHEMSGLSIGSTQPTMFFSYKEDLNPKQKTDDNCKSQAIKCEASCQDSEPINDNPQGNHTFTKYFDELSCCNFEESIIEKRPCSSDHPPPASVQQACVPESSKPQFPMSQQINQPKTSPVAEEVPKKPKKRGKCKNVACKFTKAHKNVPKMIRSYIEKALRKRIKEIALTDEVYKKVSPVIYNKKYKYRHCECLNELIMQKELSHFIQQVYRYILDKVLPYSKRHHALEDYEECLKEKLEALRTSVNYSH